ncbi:MAG: hypothetical protein M1318_06075 [Firmicutes bacterium]|nr:hypothetical protein [Bacillota bacterium]
MRYVAFHPQYGICLGYTPEASFWSFLHAEGAQAAITFASIEEAQRTLSLLSIDPQSPMQYIPIHPDHDDRFASPLACFMAGLPLWSAKPLPIN